MSLIVAVPAWDSGTGGVVLPPPRSSTTEPGVPSPLPFAPTFTRMLPPCR